MEKTTALWRHLQNRRLPLLGLKGPSQRIGRLPSCYSQIEKKKIVVNFMTKFITGDGEVISASGILVLAFNTKLVLIILHLIIELFQIYCKSSNKLGFLEHTYQRLKSRTYIFRPYCKLPENTTLTLKGLNWLVLHLFCLDYNAVCEGRGRENLLCACTNQALTSASPAMN